MAKKLQLHGSFPSKAGDSAYQVAQKNGFEGTEQEWLASLVGPQGPQGPKGDTPSENYPTLLPRATWWGSTNYALVAEVRFVENYSPATYDKSWDAGVEAGTITAYREGDIVTVSANGKRKIKLNPYSAAMFNNSAKLKTIRGLDMLDASEVTTFGGMFAYCSELTSVDMSSWYCDKVTSIGGMFQYCRELRNVKMPRGLNSDTLTVAASTFEECFKLVDVDLGNGPAAIGDKMFAKCISLERVVGLNAATTIGARAFIYCSKLKDIDVDPAIVTSIGESAFRLSSVEDCINMDDLNASCTIAEMATRATRWSDSAALAAVQDRIIPTVMLRVPHADSQLRYHDVKFGHRNVPWDDTEDAVDVYISEGGCSALSLYHEWQCIYRGTDSEKDSFLQYWEAFEGDKFVNNNVDGVMGDFFPVQAEMLGWEHTEVPVTSVDQLDVIIERLSKHLPTGAIMNSANIDGCHAVLIVGGDSLSGKLAVLDSKVSSERAELAWVKFEDIFTADNDGDRLVLHTYGDSFVEPDIPEYIPAPDTATVGQTVAVKAVDETGKPTMWEAVDMASGGGYGWQLLTTVTTTENVTSLTVNTGDDGVMFKDKQLTELTAFLEIPGNADLTSTASLTVTCGWHVMDTSAAAIPNVLSSKKQYARVHCKACGDGALMWLNPAAGAPVHMVVGYGAHPFSVIPQICFFSTPSDIPIPTGTVIKVYGR